MSVNDLAFDAGASAYYDADFRNVLEDHMSFLRKHSSTRTIVVDPGQAYKYEYDLYGYLLSVGIPANLHWVVLRLNKLTTPTDFSLQLSQLMVPDAGMLDKIRQSHMSTRKLA